MRGAGVASAGGGGQAAEPGHGGQDVLRDRRSRDGQTVRRAAQGAPDSVVSTLGMIMRMFNRLSFQLIYAETLACDFMVKGTRLGDKDPNLFQLYSHCKQFVLLCRHDIV